MQELTARHKALRNGEDRINKDCRFDGVDVLIVDFDAHCGGGTRNVFRTQRAWIDHLVRNARNLTGRTFQQDIVDCATALPNAGSDGYSGLVQLGQICQDLRASADTCRFVRLQKNLYITVGN